MPRSADLIRMATSCERCGAFIGMAEKETKWCSHCSEPDGVGTVCYWRRCAVCEIGAWTPSPGQEMCWDCSNPPEHKERRGDDDSSDNEEPLAYIETCLVRPPMVDGPAAEDSKLSEECTECDRYKGYICRCVGCLSCCWFDDPGQTHCEECYVNYTAVQMAEALCCSDDNN